MRVRLVEHDHAEVVQIEGRVVIAGCVYGSPDASPGPDG
jgi:hypothetical protein